MVRSRLEKHISRQERETDSGSDSSRSRSGSRSSASGKSRSRSASRSSGSQSPAKSRSDRSASRSRSRSGSGSPKKIASDSESAEGGGAKKRQLSGSDQEETEGSPKQKKDEDVGAEDLFGDDLSVSSEDEADQKSKKAVIDSDGDNVQRYDDDEDGGNKRRPVIGSDSDDDEGEKEKKTTVAEDYNQTQEQENIPETRIDVEVPKINTDLGKEIHFVKLPNFLSMDSRPFDPDTYEDELDEDQNQQDEEGNTRLKLKVENTIRWRQSYDKDGNPVKQSNARVVKWSDGSYSLHLGNEIFDAYKQPLQSDFNHLFIRQGTGLQGQAVFRTKLSFRPHSVDSHTHKKMTMSMADRSTKSNQIKVISHVGNNPEEGRYARMKTEEQNLRMSIKADATRKRVNRQESHYCPLTKPIFTSRPRRREPIKACQEATWRTAMTLEMRIPTLSLPSKPSSRVAPETRRSQSTPAMRTTAMLRRRKENDYRKPKASTQTQTQTGNIK